MEILIALCKLIVALCYMVVIVAIVPRLDAALHLSRIRQLRIYLFVFLALGMTTYLHASYSAYTGTLATVYSNSYIYIASVLTHAISGVVVTYFCWNISNPRLTDEQYYRQLLNRMIDEETAKVAQDLTEEQLKALAKDTNDMASLLMKAYKK